MNDLEAIYRRPESVEAMELGLSPLHARIKAMECVLHISYKLGLQKPEWRVTPKTRPDVEKRQAEIKRDLKNHLGIKVDAVKSGFGSSNNGNLSRRFFGNVEVTADITSFDPRLLLNLSVLLDVVNCNIPINIKKFAKYCRETAQLYVELYSWYYMPNTIHKLLIHEPQIAQIADLPLGALGE